MYDHSKWEFYFISVLRSRRGKTGHNARIEHVHGPPTGLYRVDCIRILKIEYVLLGDGCTMCVCV